MYNSEMRVPARIIAPENNIDTLLADRSLQQLANVATLSGIQDSVWAMPDMHEGYGFPIGGVAATNIAEGGVISPGGIGYDINCGVRLLTTTLDKNTLYKHANTIANHLQRNIPSGVGTPGPLSLQAKPLRHILAEGVHTLHEWGYATQEDITFCENNGIMPSADPACVSKKAVERGSSQLGTLGSGNHFLEIQEVTEIYDKETAKQFGIKEGMITIMIHCGSRGLGHQICSDYVKKMHAEMHQYGISVPDPALTCAPFDSDIGQQYYKAMSAAANFAWANRQMITHIVRNTLQEIFGNIEATSVYDISHNIGKKEHHSVHGRDRSLLVHRKGATRAFGTERTDVPDVYSNTGHPVLVPGTMGTSSFVMVGQNDNLAFGSCCHGAGRVMSRRKARNTVDATHLQKTLERYNVIVSSESHHGFVEEAPHAYKNVIDVVNTVSCAHLARPIARMVPRIVIKG